MYTFLYVWCMLVTDLLCSCARRNVCCMCSNPVIAKGQRRIFWSTNSKYKIRYAYTQIFKHIMTAHILTHILTTHCSYAFAEAIAQRFPHEDARSHRCSCFDRQRNTEGCYQWGHEGLGYQRQVCVCIPNRSSILYCYSRRYVCVCIAHTYTQCSTLRRYSRKLTSCGYCKSKQSFRLWSWLHVLLYL